MTTRFKWKIQGQYATVAADYPPFVSFCANMLELSMGQLDLEPHGAGEVVGVASMFDAVKNGQLDAIITSPAYVDALGANFLASYPLGMDRPDQWETWYYDLGGLELARRMFEPHGVFFLAPLQHDLNIIHSRVPVRSFDDFKGLKLRMPGGLIADVFQAAGAKTVFLSGDQVYSTLQSGAIDAADFVGPATNWNMGFGNVAKYIIVGPPATPCLHQPVDLHCLLVNQLRWNALPKHLQQLLEVATRRFSWDRYAVVQKQDIAAWEKFRDKGVEIIRLSNTDVDKFRRVAIPIWFKWAQKDSLGREALASQIEYMKSPSVGYLTDEMLVDAKGNRLTL